MIEVGVQEFLKESRRMLKLVKKPGGSELTLTLRVIALGTAVLGSVGYAFQLVGSALRTAGAPRVAREVVLVVVGTLMVVTLIVLLYVRRRGL